MGDSHTLILGIGNVLLGDEGVGVEAVRLLEGCDLPDGVTLLDGGTGGFTLLEELGRHERVILIDACLDQESPGTVRVLRPRFAADFPRVLSSHDIGLRDLLETAALLGHTPVIDLVTVSIDADQDMGIGLSPAVEAALGPVLERVMSLLEESPRARGGRSQTHA